MRRTASRRSALRELALVAAASLLGGCLTVGPDYVSPAPTDLHVPDSWQGVLASTQDGLDVASWWRQLGDPLLSRLIADALHANPDVQSARARLGEARARRRLAAAELWPTLRASASAEHLEPSGESGVGGAEGFGVGVVESQDLFATGLDLSWQPDLVGGQRRAREAATYDLEAAEASLQDARVTLAAEVARDYVELRSHQAQIAIARANLSSQMETLELTDWRVQAGLASSVDAEQARTNVERTRALIPSLDTSLAEAGHRLAILVGLAPAALGAELAPVVPIPQIPEPLTLGIPADVIRQRPDVAAAERTLAAETARIGKAMAARYPTLDLSGSIGLEALTVGALTQGTSLAASAVGNLAQTIFDGGRIAAQVEIQTSAAEQALHGYQAAVLTALEEVENALVSLANHRARAIALARAVESARNAATFAHHRYTAGIIDFQTVLDTERTVLTVEESLNTARADSTIAAIALFEALGGGWSTAP